jgi:hypothetical protein
MGASIARANIKSNHKSRANAEAAGRAMISIQTRIVFVRI